MIETFLTITVWCFLTMYADGSTTCNCRQVPVEQTQKIHSVADTQVRKQNARQPRSVLVK